LLRIAAALGGGLIQIARGALGLDHGHRATVAVA